jgi:hypothetical protein
LQSEARHLGLGFKTTEQGCWPLRWSAIGPALLGQPGVDREDGGIGAPTDPAGSFARFHGLEALACDDAAAERRWLERVKMLASA